MSVTDVDIRDIEAAESVTIKEPGSNMLWVTIDWGDDASQFGVKSNPRNKMLFDKDNYQYEGKSLYTILFGDAQSRVVLQEEPFVAIQPGPYVDTYRVWSGDDFNPVLTPATRSADVLRGVTQTVEDGPRNTLTSVYETVQEEYVNRDAVIAMYNNNVYDGTDRIEPRADGLVVDGLFLLTWKDNFHIYTEAWEDGAFTPHGDAKDKPGEFRSIRVSCQMDTTDVEIGNAVYTLTEQDHLFNRRLNWILNWEDNMDDAEIASVKRTVPIIQNNDL